MKQYIKRLWLNDETSPSTGSVCAFDGMTKWGDDKQNNSRFLEVADCHCKARLHKIGNDTDQQFLDKMIKLRNFIDDFINYLEQLKQGE